MRIAYISNSPIPSRTAHTMQVMKMCQAMVQKGYEVELLIPRRPIPSDWHDRDVWRHYGIQDSFPIRGFPYCRHMSGHIHGLLGVLKARHSKADIVYARHLPAAAIALCMRMAVVWEAHQVPGGLAGPMYLRLLRLGESSRRLIVVITHALRRDLVAAYPEQMEGERITVAPDGVDIERFENLPDVQTARHELGLEMNGFLVGYSGHFYRGKGIEVVLHLATRCPNTHFLLVGGEPDAVAAVKAELEGKGVKNVSLPGFVPNSELPLYLAACDILLLPSQRKVSGSGGGDIARWTSPMKLFEYMACGRLIIASDLPVLREVVSEQNALLCDPEDLDAWEQGLERAVEDKAWRQRLGQQALRDARRYAWTRRVDVCLQPIVQNLPHAKT